MSWKDRLFWVCFAILVVSLIVIFAQELSAQQPQRQESPADLNLRSLSYKFAACQIDTKILSDDNAAKDAKIAKLEKELAEAKQVTKQEKP